MCQANFASSYKLAEKLSDRLDEMSKDLTTMIEEINVSSSALKNSSKADDTVRELHSFQSIQTKKQSL